MNRRAFLQASLAGAVGASPAGGATPQAAADSNRLSVDATLCQVVFDGGGNILKIGLRNQTFSPPLPYSYFELDGELAEAQRLRGTASLAFGVSTETAHGTVVVSSDRQVKFRISPNQKDGFKEAGLVLTYPAETTFHLAEYMNVGRRLDRDMPVGESYACQLRYNFFIAEYGGMWMSFRANETKWFSSAKCHIARHPEMFTVTFTWHAGTDAAVAVFSSMEEALSDYEAWLESNTGARKFSDRKNSPAWIQDIKLVVTADMMRSNWEIAHDFPDVLKLAKEVAEIRSPKEVLFYIPGWQGAYDSTHPTYRPDAGLGGEAQFRALTGYLHEQGFRLMIHTTGWGIDPYHPDIDALEKLAWEEEGRLVGFQIDGRRSPPAAPLKFRTPKISLNGSARDGDFSFRTGTVPARCEAHFTLGGVRGKTVRIALTVGRRTITSPAGWFESHDEYDFPFPLALAPGTNAVKVSATGGSGIDWSRSWYRIRHSFVPQSPYATETHPILRARLANPEYVRIYTENVSSVVREYGIDAVHIDATDFSYAEAFLIRLREKLPGVALGCEGSGVFKAMGFWTFWQGARQSLTDHADILRQYQRATQELFTGSKAGDREFAWLDKASPVCSFVRKYLIPYPHLCAADAFVPIGKVCNIFPARLMPAHKEELWRVLNDAKRLDYLPGLRVNYRNYGLDVETRKAIAELR